MDHLDLDGIFSTSSSSSWMLPAFDQQDANFLSSSRQMLEPIIEETSEDEDNQAWSHYENVWSSESDTGSVIRIELHNDQDSISERDFACPAKRPRRDDLLLNIEETSPQIRKYQRNELLTADNQDQFRKRFDEFYSDSDSLSFNSLSRSSSLIQFESLERQFQNDLSSIGNSSPSLLSFDAGDSKGSNGCLRRFESSDGRLHQTYYDLDKIDFENTLIFVGDERRDSHGKSSDSESSDNSILSHEERILKPVNINNASDHRSNYKGKSSAENLSEDSGYCEHITALRVKSKSIPNFLKQTEKFCEEDEFDIHKSLEMIFTKNGSQKGRREEGGHHEISLHSRNDENSERTCYEKENKRNFKTKIDAKQRSTQNVEENEEKQHRSWFNGQTDVKNKIHTNTIASPTSTSSSSSSSASSSSSSWTMSRTTPLYISSSLPDVRVQFNHDHVFDVAVSVANNSSDLKSSYDNSFSGEVYYKCNTNEKGQFNTVSSVPNDLNLISTGSNSLYNRDDHYSDDRDGFGWSLRSTKSVTSQNRFDYTACSQSAKSLTRPVQNYINASYNNLTLLDYSGRSKSNRNSFNMSDYSGNSKRNSREFELGKGNFLLDEISMHFDRNLSILNDREDDSDLFTKFLQEEKGENKDINLSPPKPPARRCNSNKEARVINAVEKPPRKSKINPDKTFDQDPTVLRTSYADSLEKCNFDPKELSNSDLTQLPLHSTPTKREFVSTPNLSTLRASNNDIADDLHVSSAHTSLNPLPHEKKLGILLTAGSRVSLGKGVSFCPIVSEIIWQEQSSEECMDPDSLENVQSKNIVTYTTTAELIITQPSNDSKICTETCVQQHDEHDHPTSQKSAQPQLPQPEPEPPVVVPATEPEPEPKLKSVIVSNAPIVRESGSIGSSDHSKQCDVPRVPVMEAPQSVVISDRANNNNKMPIVANVGVKSATMPPSTTTTTTVNKNTGTDLLSSKFKPKPDEKRHKNGFLSRFTGGFRFSLRRKKKHNNSDANANDSKNNKKSVSDNAVRQSTPGNQNKNSTSSSKESPDFIYIPLKGPLITEPPCKEEPKQNEHHSPAPGDIKLVADNNHVLRGKPPLPKQPPRVVGVCEKVRAGPHPQNALFVGGGSRHAPPQRSSSQPREIDERFLDSERRFYYNQLNGTMNGNGCTGSSAPPLSPSNGNARNPSRCPPRSAPAAGPNGGNNKIGLIETNLDTHETVISGKTRSLMELGPQVRHTLSKQSACIDSSDTAMDGTRRPHKSMEFLLDKENQKNVLPPENELQKSHDSTAALSEHQLRVQASLQRLNIPDWFRQYSSTPQSKQQQTESGCYKPGSFTRKRASDSGRWTGLNSKTTSLSSLGSQRSDRSPLLLSPSAHSHHGGQTTGFSRWSTSYLNSTQTSPSVSTRGSFSRGGPANSSFISAGGATSVRNSFRQPYLGWRSQEKLAQPRTPHERLASSLLSQKPPKPEPPVTPEIQSSIKEVTSAIVHYVNDQTSRTARSRSTSPSSRKCWLESSFVGIRPVESPQTPVIENSFNTNTTTTATSSIHSGITSTSETLRMNGVATPLPSLSIAPDRSSLSSASLEDVLASLLGLPSDSYRSTGDTANEMIIMNRITTATSPSSLQVDSQSRFRRRSEGDAQKQQHQQQQQQQHLQAQPQHQASQQSQPGANNISQTSLPSQPSRRVSLDSSESKTTSELLIKCRNTKCDQSSNPVDAKKFYKSCHNCSHLYCSRECRRAHWEKHRKACLHSRVSNLCRQVLSACKDDLDTLRHLSLLARKGYLSQGRGVVRVLFRSPENSEAFIKNGFQCLGEASYVRWPDLMPAEMGLELYSELLKLSTEYKPESKMLIYVAICVVSEAPGTATAPVKWERQLVSRCAKLKICKSILSELDQTQQIVVVQEQSTEILILTFNPHKCNSPLQREQVSTNIQTILSRRGVVLRKHYPEIYQRLQNYSEGQTDRFMPVTIHPRDNQTGQGFVCIIMPTHSENELIRLPTSDAGNRVSTIDVGEELLES